MKCQVIGTAVPTSVVPVTVHAYGMPIAQVLLLTSFDYSPE